MLPEILVIVVSAYQINLNNLEILLSVGAVVQNVLLVRALEIIVWFAELIEKGLLVLANLVSWKIAQQKFVMLVLLAVMDVLVL